jgi:hypothetical protein
VVDHVLRNTNGKILRRVLAEQFQQKEAGKTEAEIKDDILKGKLAVEPWSKTEQQSTLCRTKDECDQLLSSLRAIIVLYNLTKKIS